jgi:hypothetical protein
MVAAVRRRTPEAWRDEDFVPQLFSWIIALAVGAAWLVIIYLAPAPAAQAQPAAPDVPSVIGFMPGTVHETQPMPGATPNGAATSHTQVHTSHAALDAADAFLATAAAGVVAHLSELMPGALAVRGGDQPRAGSGKSSLATSDGASTPGMAQLSHAGGATSASFAAVGRRTMIDRAPVHVQPPPMVRAAPLGSETADATEMGAFVRGRVAQLQTCYERAGGTDLAGVVALRLSMGPAGIVRSADIVRRSWSGPGAAATEACLLGIVRGWRMPFAADGSTITVPISFTRGT